MPIVVPQIPGFDPAPAPPSVGEMIVLDPIEVAEDRVQVDLTNVIGADGVDWGDAEIAAYMADQERGASPVDYRVPNRNVSVALILRTRGTVTFDNIRLNVQAKAALFQREGGWIKRILANGEVVFADVVNARLHLSGSWMQAHRDTDLEARLELEVLPDFYSGEETLAAH